MRMMRTSRTLKELVRLFLISLFTVIIFGGYHFQQNSTLDSPHEDTGDSVVHSKPNLEHSEHEKYHILHHR